MTFAQYEIDFINSLQMAAQTSMEMTGIPASFVIAEGALESSWGRSGLVAAAMNIFGVKADASWTGPVYIMRTRECIQGKWVIQEARWRKYSSWLDSITDHAQFFLQNPRYKPALLCQTGPAFAVAAAKAGYATDPDYAAKITEIITEHDLQTLDSVALLKPGVTQVTSAPTPAVVVPVAPPAPPIALVAATPVAAPIAHPGPTVPPFSFLEWFKNLF